MIVIVHIYAIEGPCPPALVSITRNDILPLFFAILTTTKDENAKR
jgi:hypothetical protein